MTRGTGEPRPIDRRTAMVLRASSWLVPRADRRAWLAEWSAEFAHDPPAPPVRRRRQAMAVRHAWWLRWHPPQPRHRGGTSMWSHLRLAARALRRDPGFAVPAFLTLALAIGANVAVFSVVEAVLLRPLPYPDADRLVMLRHRDLRTGLTKPDVGATDMADIAARAQSLEAFAPYGFGRTTVADGGDPIDAEVLGGGAGLFAVTGVQPFLGRGLTQDDTRRDAAPVAVLGYEFWRAKLGGDPSIVGRSLQVGPARRLVVGIAPPGFALPPVEQVDIIVPMGVPGVGTTPRTTGSWIRAAGRLRAGRTVADASAELGTLSAQLAGEFPATNAGTEYFGVSARTSLAGNAERPLWLMMAAVAVLLVIAIVNVSNLLLARVLAKRGELSVRVALGAERRHLVGQVLSENLLLTLLAGIAGVGLAVWGTSALVALVPASVSIPALATVGPNLRVLGFAIGVAAATALVLSVLAGVIATRTRVQTPGALTRVSISRGTRRAATALVVAEVALAVVLLAGAGLVVRSFNALLSVDVGFDRTGVLTLPLRFPTGRYQTTASRQAFYRDAFARLHALPRVEAAGAAAVTPLTGNNWTIPFERIDRPMPAGQRAPDIGWQVATPGYFSALQIPLRAGRVFTDADATGAPVVVISESVAARFFAPGEPVVGQRVRLGNDTGEIVGVVGDIHRAALTDAPRADMYLPFERQASDGTLFVRGTSGVVPSESAVRDALRAIEPGLRLGNAVSLERVAQNSAGSTRFAMWLLSVFAGAALVLAAIGIYGVMSYAARQRSREFGTRVALGARASDILWLVLGQGVTVIAVGLTVGLALTLLAARAIRSLLFSVREWDPATLAATSAVLAAATLVACYVPARRASRTDPARTLVE
jgi:predicted permease